MDGGGAVEGVESITIIKVGDEGMNVFFSRSSEVTIGLILEMLRIGGRNKTE